MQRSRIAMIGAAFACALAAATLSAAPAFAAAGVTGDVTAGANVAYTGTNNVSGVVPTAAMNLQGLLRFTPGVASGQADKEFVDYRTITASGTDNLDLAGTLTDPLGATLTFAKVKAIMIIADAANTNDVVIAPGASNPFNGPFSGTTPSVAVKPGGVFLMGMTASGWAVTASTGDILKISNSSSGTSVSYKVVIIGTSS